MTNTGQHKEAEVYLGDVIKWTPAALVPRAVIAVLGGAASAADTVDWGDGTRSPATGAAVRHTYPEPRAYAITALQGETPLARETVKVRDGLKPAIAFAPSTDNPNLIEATIASEPEDMISEYKVTWEAGAVDRFYGPKGTVKVHGFQAGTHTVSYRDLHTGRSGATEVVVVDKEYDPDFSIGKGANVNTALLEVTKLAVPGKELVIDWGDYIQSTVPAESAAVGFQVSHHYPDPGDFIVQLVYADGSTEGSARLITIPFPAVDSDQP